MARPVTLFTGQWADLPIEDMARKTSEFGYDGIELACWGDHFEVDKALNDDGYCAAKRDLVGPLRPAVPRDQQPPRRAGGARHDRRAAQEHPPAVRLGRRQPRGRQQARRRRDEEHRPRRAEARRGRGQRLHRLEHLARTCIRSRRCRRR